MNDRIISPEYSDRFLTVRLAKHDLPPERHEWNSDINEYARVIMDLQSLGLYPVEYLPEGHEISAVSGAFFVDQPGYYRIRGEESSGETFLDSWSLCVIKPDAKELDMTSHVVDEIHRNGLDTLLYTPDIEVASQQLDQLWPSPLGDDGKPIPETPWWHATVEYMTSAPVDVLLVNGPRCSILMKAIKDSLRTEVYGSQLRDRDDIPVEQRVKSVIHTSDNPLEFVTNAFGFYAIEDIIGRVK